MNVQRVLLIVGLFCSILSAQGFFYNYVDPCNQTIIRNNYKVTQEETDSMFPIIINQDTLH